MLGGAGHGAPAARMALPGAALLDRLRDGIGALRARLTASAAFRARATQFPLTRPIARREAAALFDLCAGFVYSPALAARLRLDLVGRLRGGPQDLEALSAGFGLPPDSARCLLEAAAALGLAARRADGRYALGPLGAALVDNPGVAAMVAHHALLYDDLRDPVALLRRGRGEALGAYWAYAGDAPGGVAEPGRCDAYTGLMSASQPMVAAEICAAYDLRRHRHVLDIGGGDGSFLCAVAERARDSALTLFDLPPVAARARERFAMAGLGARAAAVAGDFRQEALPAGADLATLVRVLHDHDDAVVLDLLRRAHAALVPGGRILVAEPFAGTPGAERMGAAYFGFYLLAMGQGRPRRADEVAAMLRAAGFARPRLLRTRVPLLVGVVLAERPAG